MGGADGIEYRFPTGYDSFWRNLNKLAVAEIAGRKDKLYVYRDNAGDPRPFQLDADASVAVLYAAWHMEAKNGGVCTGKPIFLFFTPQDIKTDMLVDLNSVEFH